MQQNLSYHTTTVSTPFWTKHIRNTRVYGTLAASTRRVSIYMPDIYLISSPPTETENQLLSSDLPPPSSSLMHREKKQECSSSQSPPHGLLFQRPCEKPTIVLRVMHRLEPLVGRPIHRTKGTLHSGRPLRTQWPFFVAEELGEVSKLGHGEAVLRWPRVRTVTVVIYEGREIGVDSSTDAVQPRSRFIGK